VLQQQIAAVLEQGLADGRIPASRAARAAGRRLGSLVVWSSHMSNINQTVD
jgi:hypothetical protein